MYTLAVGTKPSLFGSRAVRRAGGLGREEGAMKRGALSRRQAAWCVAALVAAAAGCNRMDGRIPVTGRVTLDGKPLFGVVVRFYPSPDTYGNGGYGVADAAGRFTATTLQARPGLYPGSYSITLEYLDGFMPPGAEAARVRIPGGYSDPESTKLKVTVAEPRADLDLQVAGPGK
jgi:hypothetical protein